MKMKAMYSVALMVAAVVLLVTSLPVHAATMDDQIQAAAEKSYVFKTYLKDDDIKIQSKVRRAVGSKYQNENVLNLREISGLFCVEKI